MGLTSQRRSGVVGLRGRFRPHFFVVFVVSDVLDVLSVLSVLAVAVAVSVAVLHGIVLVCLTCGMLQGSVLLINMVMLERDIMIPAGVNAVNEESQNRLKKTRRRMQLNGSSRMQHPNTVKVHSTT